ncbi:unnamed protein product [Arabidopsis lyrata]|uniref:Predicted protein n=1 Tax=Arabidopsis lyrata subsp. lyrata TaxID=81972 RepID=D7KMV2_ARALL|nr:predicted protein [Arabidopsis lyrata subsp. lyrata]CAH8254594.1 unnamed protein product [Arabidopsis lyrata]
MHSSPPATAKRDLLVAIENHVGCFGGWFSLWVRLVIVEMAMTDLVLRVTLVNTVWCLDGWLCLWVRMVTLVSVVKKAFSRWFQRDNGCVLGFDCKSVKTKLGRVEFRIWPQWCGISKLRIDWVKFGIWFISRGVLTSEGESLLVQHASGGGFNRESWGVGVWMIFQRKRFNMRFNGFQRVEMGVLFLLLEVVFVDSRGTKVGWSWIAGFRRTAGFRRFNKVVSLFLNWWADRNYKIRENRVWQEQTRILWVMGQTAKPVREYREELNHQSQNQINEST